MAELQGADDPRKAAEFTAEAVRISKDGKLVDSLYIETLAEHGMALWKAGEGRISFDTFEEATNRLFAIQTEANSWKGLFARVFGVIAYFSALALDGKPQEGQIEPEGGLFLATNEQAYTSYRTEQLAYICIRLAMFADGIGDLSKAAVWTWRAIESADQIPVAQDAIRSQSWHAMPAVLLSDDFFQAAQLVAVMTATDVNNIVAKTKASAGSNAAGRLAGIEAVTNSAPPPNLKSLLSVTPIVPIAIRLAFLQFRGATTDSTAASLAVIESVIPPDSQPESFVAEIRRALIDETDWQALWNDGCRAIQVHQFIRGCVLSIGGISKAPTSQSLYMQVSVARNFEGCFKSFRSLYREIVAPFFVAYWEKTIAESTGVFRTAQAYTQRQLQLADGTPEGTRRLLAAVRFCLGLKLPEDAMDWLDPSE